MTRHRASRAARHLVFFVVSLLSNVLALQAATPESKGNRGFGFAYDAAKEITVAGTVNGFLGLPTVGGLLGEHLLISGAGQLIDADLGPYMSHENQHALRAGQPVQVTGVNETVHGKKVLLARQLIFNGRLLTIRNAHGFLVRSSGASRKISDGRAGENGGNQ
jgi:hypothetical protein